MAGVLPGILTCVVYMSTVYVMCTLNPKLARRGEQYSWKEKVSSLSKGWGAIVILPESTDKFTDRSPVMFRTSVHAAILPHPPRGVNCTGVL